jgi:hypothetical protein
VRSRLTFHGPLSEERASRLTGELAAGTPAAVLDIGCGWSELILAAVPDAGGTGVDIDGEDISRARGNAAERGLDGRATFAEGPAKEHLAGANADLILNVGAYHALGTIPEALLIRPPAFAPVTPADTAQTGLTAGQLEQALTPAEALGALDRRLTAGRRRDPVQNVGAYGQEVTDTLVSVTGWD